MARIAVLGLGEAGGRIAVDLVACGVDVRGYDPAVSSAEGVECAADPASAVAEATVVLSLTTAAGARDVAAAALPGLRPLRHRANAELRRPLGKEQRHRRQHGPPRREICPTDVRRMLRR